MTALDKFIERLNQKPILWSAGLGVIIYLCAFWVAVFAMFPRFSLNFEVGFLSAGSLVMAYHWTMSRYLKDSTIAQAIQLLFGFTLVAFSMFLIGAATHDKAYEFVNRWLY